MILRQEQRLSCKGKKEKSGGQRQRAGFMQDALARMKGQAMKTVRDLRELLHEQGLLLYQTEAGENKSGKKKGENMGI